MRAQAVREDRPLQARAPMIGEAERLAIEVCNVPIRQLRPQDGGHASQSKTSVAQIIQTKST